MRKIYLPLTIAFSCCFYSLCLKAQAADLLTVSSNSPVHSTFVSAIKAADLTLVYQDAGPFTIFAPTNAAFSKMGTNTVEELLKPASKEALTKIMTCLMVPGNLDAASINKAIALGGGKAEWNTLGGSKLTATMEDGKVKITNEKGISFLLNTTYDVKASNGIMYMIDGVLLPK
jgi:uncharacterized surface protein with fasciclin (FAS1) repeats